MTKTDSSGYIHTEEYTIRKARVAKRTVVHPIASGDSFGGLLDDMVLNVQLKLSPKQRTL